MKKITIKDFRIAALKVANNQRTNHLLENLSNDELIRVNMEHDLHVFPGQIENIIEQISKDKRIPLPNELHKVLADSNVNTLVDTINLCICEERILGINVDI